MKRQIFIPTFILMSACCILNLNAQTKELQNNDGFSWYKVTKEDKVGAMDLSNNVLVPIEKDKVVYVKGLFFGKKNGLRSVYKENGECLFSEKDGITGDIYVPTHGGCIDAPANYDDNGEYYTPTYLVLKQGWKSGLFNVDKCCWVIPFEFECDSIKAYYEPDKNNGFWVQKDAKIYSCKIFFPNYVKWDKWDFSNTMPTASLCRYDYMRGAYKSPTPITDSITLKERKVTRKGFAYYLIKENNLYGVTDETGKIIVPAKYIGIDACSYYGEYFKVLDSNNKVGLYSLTGKCIISCTRGYDMVGPRHNGIWVMKGDKEGYCSLAGKVILEPKHMELDYNELEGFTVNYEPIGVKLYGETLYTYDLNAELMTRTTISANTSIKKNSSPIVLFTLTPPASYGSYWNEKKVDGSRYTVSIRPTISDNNENALYICVDQKPYSSGTENTNTIPSGMDPTGGLFGGIIASLNTQNVYYYGDDDVKIVCVRADGHTLEYNASFSSQKQTNYPQNPYKHFFINSSTGCRVNYADTYKVYYNGSLVATYNIPGEEYFGRFAMAARNNDRLSDAYLVQNMQQYNQLMQMQMNDYNSGVYDAPSISTGTSTTIQTEKRCHLCAGTGICTTCNGRGQMINSYTGQYQDCPNCHAPLEGKCHSCGGTGRK